MACRRRTEPEVLLASPFRSRLLLGLTLAGSCAGVQANTCLQPALLHQRQDEATVQRLEETCRSPLSEATPNSNVVCSRLHSPRS